MRLTRSSCDSDHKPRRSAPGHGSFALCRPQPLLAEHVPYRTRCRLDCDIGLRLFLFVFKTSASNSATFFFSSSTSVVRVSRRGGRAGALAEDREGDPGMNSNGLRGGAITR